MFLNVFSAWVVKSAGIWPLAEPPWPETNTMRPVRELTTCV